MTSEDDTVLAQAVRVVCRRWDMEEDKVMSALAGMVILSAMVASENNPAIGNASAGSLPP